MTTIAAIQGKNFAVVAFDSMVTEDNGRSFILPADMPKVIRDENCLFGSAGDLRIINLLSISNFDKPSSNLRGRALDVWFGGIFIQELREILEEGMVREKESGSYEGNVLAVFNSTIYEVGPNYEWLRSTDGIYAVGSGGSYALGNLQAAGPKIHKNFLLAEQAAQRAVEAAIKYDYRSRGPVRTEIVQTST